MEEANKMNTVYTYNVNTMQYDGTAFIDEAEFVLPDGFTSKSPSQTMMEVIDRGMNQYVIYDKKKKKWKFDFSKFDKVGFINDLIYSVKCQIRQDISNFQTVEYNGHIFDARQKYFDRYVQKMVLADHNIVSFPISIPDENDVMVSFENPDGYKAFIKAISDRYDLLYSIGRLIKYGGEVDGIQIIPLSEYSEEELLTTPYEEIYQQIKDLLIK